jgi:taurine--2-oxoglutarate transaminase
MTDVTTEPAAPTTFRVPTDQATVRANDRQHVFHSWSAQGAITPLPIARAQGSRFWDYDGKDYLDFSSGLVHANIGYGHPKLVAAVQEQAGRMATIAPGYAVDVRSEAARLIASKAPDGLEMVFFTNGGAEATENAIRMARLHTGRHKVFAAYRSYHGATAGALTMTGDPRRMGVSRGCRGSSTSGGLTPTAARSTRPAPSRRPSGRWGICAT